MDKKLFFEILCIGARKRPPKQWIKSEILRILCIILSFGAYIIDLAKHPWHIVFPRARLYAGLFFASKKDLIGGERGRKRSIGAKIADPEVSF
jgi:hypothetical protein